MSKIHRPANSETKARNRNRKKKMIALPRLLISTHYRPSQLVTLNTALLLLCLKLPRDDLHHTVALLSSACRKRHLETHKLYSRPCAVRIPRVNTFLPRPQILRQLARVSCLPTIFTGSRFSVVSMATRSRFVKVPVRFDFFPHVTISRC